MIHKTTDCKQCGKSFRKSNKKAFCSYECRRSHNDTKPFSRQIRTFICASCGNECTRAVRRNVTHWMCGRECQLAWTNRPVQRDWAVASSNAKARWKKESSKERKNTSTAAQWFRAAESKASDLKQISESDWQRKCHTASATLGSRLSFIRSEKPRKKHKTWKSLCESKLNNNYSNMGEWQKKCYSTCKNMKWRRRLLNARKHTSTPIVDAEQQPKQLSIWEFLETQQRTN